MSFVYPSLKESSLQICKELSRIPSESFRAVRQKRCASFLNYAIDPETWHMNLNWLIFVIKELAQYVTIFVHVNGGCAYLMDSLDF
jgi:hypothetical protein